MRAGGLKYTGSFYVYDPIRLYALRPGATGWVEGEGESYMAINSDGMHDREHTLGKPSGTVRVAFMGDSETNAEHLPFDENMVQLAQKELQRDPGHVELLNFAVGGYTLAEQIYTFRDHAAKYQPDIVILMLSPVIIRASKRELNTFESPSPSFILRGGHLVPDPLSPALRAPDPRWLAVRNHLAQLQNDIRVLALIREATQTGLRQKLPQIRALFGGSAAAAASQTNCPCGPPSSEKMEEAWQISAALIERLNETVQAHNARLWIVSLGDGSQIIPNPEVRRSTERRYGTTDIEYADRRMGAIATRLGIGFLPVAPALLDYAVQRHLALRGSDRTPPYVGHLNREGHRAMGPILADFIRAALHQPLHAPALLQNSNLREISADAKDRSAERYGVAISPIAAGTNFTTEYN